MNKKYLQLFTAFVIAGLCLNSMGQAASMHQGTVVETMNSGGYTYVQVDTGEGKIWAAAPQFTVKVGDEVSMPEGMPMADFYSKTLDRKFELLYMVNTITVGGGAPAGHPATGATPQMPTGHPAIGAGQTAAGPVDLSGISKAPGGYTVEELFTQKSDLAGKRVAVRGKVIKFTPQIMGKNWVHLADGTGTAEAKTNDLTLTTNDTFAVGDTVTLEGLVAVDKDFGYGYFYELILEEAAVLPEAPQP